MVTSAPHQQDTLFSRRTRIAGLIWVGVSLTVLVVGAQQVSSADGYLLMFTLPIGAAYVLPTFVVGAHVIRRIDSHARLSYKLLYTHLVTVHIIGLGMVLGVMYGWRWANPLGVPAVILSGLLNAVPLTMLARRMSGHRALTVDLMEASATVIALVAPLVVIWGPAVASSEAAWFALPAAATLPFALWALYWTAMMCVRAGPGWGSLERFSLVLAISLSLNAVAQVAQAMSGFTLPAAPFIGLHGLAASMYLLIPLHVPVALRKGLDRLPPQGQVRGARFTTLTCLAGTGCLLVASTAVDAHRPWVIPFSLVTVTVLLCLAGARNMAASEETKRLYRHVEEAEEELRVLVGQLLERSVDDSRDFASQMYEQAVAAYVAVRALAEDGPTGLRVAPDPASEPELNGFKGASALLGKDLARRAEAVREIMVALRPGNGRRSDPARLRAPIAAHLLSIYGDQPTPRLSLHIADEVALDWITETMVLQILRAALHNVHQHSGATAVEISLRPSGDAATLRIADDGAGFCPVTAPDGSGITTMRASAAVLGGNLVIESEPDHGTVITTQVRLGSGHASKPALHVVSG